MFEGRGAIRGGSGMKSLIGQLRFRAHCISGGIGGTASILRAVSAARSMKTGALNSEAIVAWRYGIRRLDSHCARPPMQTPQNCETCATCPARHTHSSLPIMITVSQAPALHANASAAVLVNSWHRTTRPLLIVHKWTSGESIGMPVALTLA